MSNAVIVTSRCANENVDALNRVAQSATDMQNGTPLALAWSTTAGSAVFTATQAEAGASGVWLAYSPEVNKLVVGKTWGGLDPRNFTNLANVPFDCFKPQVGDIILVTKDFFASTKDPATVTGATVVELTANGFEAKVSATASYAGIGFKIGRTDSMTIASQNVLTAEGVTAYYLECTQN